MDTKVNYSWFDWKNIKTWWTKLSEPDTPDIHEMAERENAFKMYTNDRIAFNEKARAISNS